MIRKQWPKRGASSLLSPCEPADGTQHVNIALFSLLGRRTHLGRALGRRRSITEAFSEGRIKGRPRLWGLMANSLRSFKSTSPEGWRERIKPGSQRRLFIKCERRRSGFKINFHPLLLLLLPLGVSGCDGCLLDGKAGARDYVLLDCVMSDTLPWTIQYLVSKNRHLTMPSNCTVYCSVKSLQPQWIAENSKQTKVTAAVEWFTSWRKMNTNLLWNVVSLKMGPLLTPTGNDCDC